MTGDVPPATRLDQFDALGGQDILADEQILTAAVAAQSDGARVFQHIQGVLGPCRDQRQPPQLDRFGLGVTDKPQINDIHAFSRDAAPFIT